ISETTSPNVGTITVGNLGLRAVNAIAMTNANDVTVGALGASVTGAGQGIAFIDANDLTVGSPNGVNGITTNGGAVFLNTTNGNLAVTTAINAGSAPIALVVGGTDHLFSNTATITNGGVNPISIAADRMDLKAVITNTST